MTVAPETVEGNLLPRLRAGDEPPLKEPPPRSIRESLRELKGSRDLLRQMVRRDLATKHAGSFFGFFWSLLTPALTVLVYATVFYVMGFKPVGGEFKGYPFALFFFSGLILWNVFNAGLAGGTGSVVGQGFIVRKIYFPRELLPLAVVLSGLVTYCFELSVVIVFQSALGHPPHWTIVLTVPLILITAALAFGCGLFLSAANVYFRDLQHFINVLLQLLFWGAPVIYDISFVQGQHPGAVSLLKLNPLTDLLVAFRETLLLGRVPGLVGIAYALALALVSIVIGWVYFNRHERRMAELV
jgi:lipopolysaccharide transport system permease protein